jgi:hypothetical protein
MDDEIPDDENPTLGWPKNDRTGNVRDGLFVTDAELIRRLGVGERTGRVALFALDKASGFRKRIRCSAISAIGRPCENGRSLHSLVAHQSKGLCAGGKTSMGRKPCPRSES